MTKVEQFRQIATEIGNLYERKNHDYGDSFGETFKKLGIISAVTRINDKVNRLTNLAVGTHQQVNDESMKDTLRDTAAYAIMTLIELENQNQYNNE